MASSSTEPTVLNREVDDDDSKPAAEDEDTGAQVAPIVQLQEVAVSTGEENEDVLLDLKSKLYRFDKEGSQWKERGVGTVKLLKHRETDKVRLLVRQNKTLKICANHLVLPTMSLQEHQGNEKSCVWHASDFADGELKEETFCIRFASIEDCKTFKKKIEEVTRSESVEAESAASLVAKLSIKSNDKEEEKAEEKEAEAPSSSAEEKDDAKQENAADDK